MPDEYDDDPDDFQRGCYGPDMVGWQPEPAPPLTTFERERLYTAAESLTAAYKELGGAADELRDLADPVVLQVIERAKQAINEAKGMIGG